MREIKFRAWDEAEQRMRCVFGLSYMDKKNTEGEPEWRHTNQIQEIAIENEYDKDAFVKPMWVEAIGYRIMQFTGLKDKNGKEIWEGDLLRYCIHYPIDFQERNPLKKHGRIAGPVIWEKGWLWVDYRPKDDDGTLLYEEEAKGWEVIGNIYENQELLK